MDLSAVAAILMSRGDRKLAEGPSLGVAEKLDLRVSIRAAQCDGGHDFAVYESNKAMTATKAFGRIFWALVRCPVLEPAFCKRRVGCANQCCQCDKVIGAADFTDGQREGRSVHAV